MQGNLYTVIVITHASLFSGFGGWDLAAEWMGYENIFQCEISPFPAKVLRNNFPTVKLYGDIKQFTGEEYAGKIDILSCSPPCQAASLAGKRRGTGDDRWLWQETFRVIHTIKPTFTILENVRGILTLEEGLVFEKLLTDLESYGYELQTFCIPACAIDAWHRRDRIWIVAHANKHQHSQPKSGGEGTTESAPNPNRPQDRTRWESAGTDCKLNPNDRSKRTQRRKYEAIPKLRGLQRSKDGGIYANIEGRPDLSTPVLCRSYDGIPNGMERVKGYGNAIVPQIAYQIFQSLPLCSI